MAPTFEQHESGVAKSTCQTNWCEISNRSFLTPPFIPQLKRIRHEYAAQGGKQQHHDYVAAGDHASLAFSMASEYWYDKLATLSRAFSPSAWLPVTTTINSGLDIIACIALAAK
jgi:hypothetical protein